MKQKRKIQNKTKKPLSNKWFFYAIEVDICELPKQQ
jgi:hypothetical protein